MSLYSAPSSDDYYYGDEHDPRCVDCREVECACDREQPLAFAAGDRVVYRPRYGPAEEGTVTSANDSHVFVCYGLPGSTSKATKRADLEHVRRSA